MHAQWSVDRNPMAHLGARAGFAVCPQQAQAVPRQAKRFTSSGELAPLESARRSLAAELGGNLADLSWSGGPPVWTATTVAPEGQDRLWVDLGAGLTEQFMVRSASEMDTQGQWHHSGTTLSMYALVTDPGTLGWTVARDSETVIVTDHGNTAPGRYARDMDRRRYIAHPTLGGFTYPSPPERTLNYGNFAMRQHDIQSVKTLGGNLLNRDLYTWDDIVITEVWNTSSGGNLTMLASFFDALHRMRTDEPAIGRYMTWQPKDLNFATHAIIPVALSAGSTEMDLRPWRERKNTKNDSYLDRVVSWSFRLAPVRPLVDTFLIAEGY